MTKLISKHRSEAFQKQEGLCYYCSSPMWLSGKKDFAFKHKIPESAAARFQCTAEHLIARCDGGSNEKNNIVAACLFCNKTRHQMKRPLEPHKYRMHILRRLRLGKWIPKELQHFQFDTA